AVIALSSNVWASRLPAGIRSPSARSPSTGRRMAATTPVGEAGGKAAETRVPSASRTSTTGLSGAGGGKAVLARRQSASATAFGSPRLPSWSANPAPRSTSAASGAVIRIWVTASSASKASNPVALPLASVLVGGAALADPNAGAAAAPGRAAADGCGRRPLSSSALPERANRPTLPVSSGGSSLSAGAAEPPKPSSKLSPPRERAASGVAGRRGSGGGGGGIGTRPEPGGRAASPRSSSSSLPAYPPSSLSPSPSIGIWAALEPARRGGGGGGGIGSRRAALVEEGTSGENSAAMPPPRSMLIRKSPT